MEAHEKMTKARVGLTLDNPFFGSLALNLQLIEDPHCNPPTMYTNGIVLGFHPDFVNAMTLEECKTGIAHECMHCAMGHMVRRGERDPLPWNFACDYAVNPILEKAGFAPIKNEELGIDWLCDPKFEGKYAEEIYDMFPKINIGIGNGKGKNGGKNGKNGNGFKGMKGFDRVRDGQSKSGSDILSDSEKREIEQEWKIKTAQAAQQAKQMGNLPGGLERFIGDILDAKVHWRDLLREFVNESARNDYSWRIPNRRYMQQGFYLPGLQSEEIGEAVVIIDTSGSIGQNELSQFAGEISQIFEDFPGINIRVLYVDTHVAGEEYFTHDDLPVQLHAHGGGGTNFAPGFNKLDREGVDLKFLLYFTDMWCNSYPDFTPPYPVMWVNTSGERAYGDPPFGEVIDITLE